MCYPTGRPLLDKYNQKLVLCVKLKLWTAQCSSLCKNPPILRYSELIFYETGECESQCENCTAERTDPELWKQRLMAINDIRSHVISLEQEHKQHRKITHRLTRHGSK